VTNTTAKHMYGLKTKLLINQLISIINYLNKLKVNTASRGSYCTDISRCRVNKTLKTKLLASVPQNEPTGFGRWQTFYSLKPKVEPKLLKT